MIINKKKNYKKLFVIFLIIILLFLITILIVKINNKIKQQKLWEQEVERVRKYTSIENFQSIQEVAAYLNCEFIKQEDSKKDNIDYDIYMKLPVKYNNTTENKNFTENLIQFSAYVLKYKNFVIIDEKNNTTILVTCNEEKQLISTFYINGIENYFDVIDSKNNAKQANLIETVASMEITSDVLNTLIQNNWYPEKINFGTKESYYRNYDIYFDEGIQVRKVAGKVFNIVFTDKYQDTIINNLKPNSSIDEIKQTLGKPQFEDGNLVGYKGENAYVFFCNNQVSVYRIEQYETDVIAKIINEKASQTDNVRDFVEEIRKVWKDYDVYQFDENNVKLQYALKGLVIKYDSTTKKGVLVYSNYKGKILRR